jgi:hypothetical protein
VTAYELVCQQLLEVTGYAGRNGSWRCPVHEDRHPSLSVNQGNERALVKCHAGCPTPDVVAALKLTLVDLFDKPAGSDIVATYNYVDETWTLLYQVVRKTGKRFLCRRPDGDDWAWNLDGTRRVLYRLPETIAAVAAGTTVLIPEGERDVDRARADGHVATCNPHGAGKWCPEYNETFRGAHVVIVADRDQAGYAHARDVARHLQGIAATVRVVGSAVGNDLSDHLAAGHTIDELVPVDPGDNPDDTAPLEVTVVTLDEFTDIDEPGAEPLLGEGDDALIPANGDVMFYGDGGAGKTTLTIDLACHFGAGDNWLGITVPRSLTILIVENEGPRPLFRKKLTRKRNAWAGSPINGRVRIVEDPRAILSFADDTHRDALAKTIAEHGCDVVLIGPVSKSGMTDAGTLAEVRGFTTLVAEVRHRSGRPVTFVLVHHENRAGTPSGAWEGAVDTLLHVTGMGHGRTRLHVQKARWSSTWHARTLELNWTDGDNYEVDEKPEITDDDIAAQILAYVSANPGTGWTKVEEATPGVQRQRRRTIRDRLFGDGVIVNIVKQDGHDVALDHCPERRQARLYRASDPTISHLRPDPGAAGAQTAPSTDGAPTASAPLRPDPKEGAGGGADAGGPSDLFNTNGLGSCHCGHRNVFGPCPQHSPERTP